MKESLQKGVPLGEITKNYTNFTHTQSQNMDVGEKYWTKIKYDYHADYDTNDRFFLNKQFGDRYNIHNDTEVNSNTEAYWNLKEEDQFYEKPRIERIKSTIKDKLNKTVRFYQHYWLYILLCFFFVNYNAFKQSNQIFLFV